MFHQTFEPHDLLVIGILVVLEGLLSLDNALVLGLLARRLPKEFQTRALTYGLVGAIIFRIAAVAMATALLQWRIAKLLGGLYLLYVALKNLLSSKDDPEDVEHRATAIPSFWFTVGAIELTDIAFAVDSILAAIALVGNPPSGNESGGSHSTVHPKLWVVMVGGIAGVVLMRFAAVLFIKLLNRFPRFETSAYLLVLVIGAKMLVDWAFNHPGQAERVNFNDVSSPGFWMFWGLMALSAGYGFLPTAGNRAVADAQSPARQ